jgi:histidyl-tRNA synthetase
VIIGPDELARNEAQLKDLRGGEEQRAIPLDDLLGTVIDALVSTSE